MTARHKLRVLPTGEVVFSIDALWALLHDLRGPVSGILMNGEYLRDEVSLEDSPSEAVDDLLAAGRQLLEHITNLSTLLERGKGGDPT